MSAGTAAPPPWVDALATLAAPDARPTSLALRTVLAPPFGGVAVSSGCQIALRPGLQGTPAIAAITVQAPDGCRDGAAIARLQLLLAPVGPQDLAGLRQRLLAVAGRPCFDGAYVANPRRRAPPLHLLAWSGPGRDLVLAQDESMPGGLSITFERRDLRPPEAAAPAPQDAADHVLPPACRTTR